MPLPGDLLAQQVARAVALRVQIDDQGAQPLLRADGRQVAGDRGLAHAVLAAEFAKGDAVCQALDQGVGQFLGTDCRA